MLKYQRLIYNVGIKFREEQGTHFILIELRSLRRFWRVCTG